MIGPFHTAWHAGANQLAGASGNSPRTGSIRKPVKHDPISRGHLALVFCDTLILGSADRRPTQLFFTRKIRVCATGEREIHPPESCFGLRRLT